MDHTIDFDDLNQVELAAQDASAAMLRYLIRQVERRMAREPEAHGEHAQILLLKLHHLLTQQQVHAAHHARQAHYLAPDLVIGDARPHAAVTRRSRNAEH